MLATEQFPLVTQPPLLLVMHPYKYSAQALFVVNVLGALAQV